VKKTLPILLTSTMLSIFSLYAEVDTQDIGTAEIDAESPKAEEDSRGPFKINLSGDYIWGASVDNCHRLGDVTFATADVEFNFIYYYDECFQEGASIALVYEDTYLDLSKNPYFSQKNYEMGCLLFNVFTKRLEDWEWRAQASLNFDNLPHWNFSDYMNYDILAWGRYACWPNLGIHAGCFVQTGMEFNRVYPIIGLDWEIDSRWKLNLVFPVNISAVYTIDPAWSVALAGRFITQRHRTKRDEPVSQALWIYQTAGAEFALNYNPLKSIFANVHAGYSFGGHLTIRDHNYHHPRRLRLNGAPYAGAEVDLHF